MKNHTKNMAIVVMLAGLFALVLTACPGPMGPQGPQGEPGLPGSSGTLVEIRDGVDTENTNQKTWWLDGVDTHIPTTGKDGALGALDSVLTIGANGNWFIDGADTGRPARGVAGQNGTAITISANNTWVLDGVDSHIPLTGPSGTLSSVLSIGGNGNWYIDGADTGVSASSGGGNGNGGEPPPPPHTHAYAWRFVMPMPNIASLLEEEVCTICEEPNGDNNKRKSYKNLRHWLTESPQTDGGKGSAVTNPIEVPVAIALGATDVDTGGWGDLLYAVAAAQKYVSLDLTDCTMSITAFNGSTFTTGKSFVVSIIFPRVAVPTGTSTVSVHDSFTNLRSVSGYGNVGNYAFQNATANATLKEASFPNATSIGSYAFQNCTGLTTVSFPNVTTFSIAMNNNGVDTSYAFQNCTGLTSVSFPNATNIPAFTFSNCTGLTEVSFPEATTIQASAFDGCTNLVKAYFLKVTTFNTNASFSGAFNGCTKLAEVYFAKAASIPASTTTALSMFNGCTALTTLYIPLVRTIGNNALTSSDSLTKITIARNCAISATGQSARVTAFKTYYDGAAAGQPNKAAGTYNYVGSAWTGDF